MKIKNEKYITFGFKGKHHSAESKLKMRLAKLGKPGNMLGKKHSKESVERGVKNRSWYKHHSEETLNKIRKWHRENENPKPRLGIRLSEKEKINLRNHNSGNKHPQWKGGKIAYLRKKVLEKNNWICIICKFSDKEIMIVDHIKPRIKFPELYLDITNMQVLCPNCNAKKTLHDIREYKYITGRPTNASRNSKIQISK